jgi:hypothetical protein
MLSTAHGLAAYTAAIRALSGVVADPGVAPRIRLSARRSIGRYHAHVARQLVRERQPAAARQHALAALMYHPFHRPAWRWATIALVRSLTARAFGDLPSDQRATGARVRRQDPC